MCAYDPVGIGLPYNYLLFNDSREPLVDIALQVLIVCLDKESQPDNDEVFPIYSFTFTVLPSVVFGALIGCFSRRDTRTTISSTTSHAFTEKRTLISC